MNKKNYPIGHSFASGEQTTANLFEKGSDFVFIVFPCDKNKFGLDLNVLTKNKLFNSGKLFFIFLKN